LEFTNQVAEVSGFANLLNPLRDIPIIKAALAYDHLDTGETIVLVINQALYFGDQLDDIIIKPNQLQAFGILWMISQNIWVDQHTQLLFQRIL
jgi:hypothetical protein